jgi:hypothetical protein
MYTEIAAFTMFTTLAILYRKKPTVHRFMIVLAALSVVSAATGRIDFIHHAFGDLGWWGQFGPSFVLGAAILAARALFSTAGSTGHSPAVTPPSTRQLLSPTLWPLVLGGPKRVPG